MSLYTIIHVETNQEITIESSQFDRNKILESVSKKLGTEFNKNKYGEYKIHPQVMAT